MLNNKTMPVYLHHSRSCKEHQRFFDILICCQFFIHLLSFQVSPCKGETNEHQTKRRLTSYRIVKYQAVAVVFLPGFFFSCPYSLLIMDLLYIFISMAHSYYFTRTIKLRLSACETNFEINKLQFLYQI